MGVCVSVVKNVTPRDTRRQQTSRGFSYIPAHFLISAASLAANFAIISLVHVLRVVGVTLGTTRPREHGQRTRTPCASARAAATAATKGERRQWRRSRTGRTKERENTGPQKEACTGHKHGGRVGPWWGHESKVRTHARTGEPGAMPGALLVVQSGVVGELSSQAVDFGLDAWKEVAGVPSVA